ncbi:MAG: tRNA adenosine(34) deaminase TadA [Cellulosilyticaceae bacterium]
MMEDVTEIREQDEKYMAIALEEAQKAFELDETPIGAVIVYEGQIIGQACNRRNTDKHALAHAEILAIDEACKHMGDWRLEECTIYITLEPCPMCAGAIVQARIPRVVYGASSPKAGFGGSVLNILQLESLNHRCEVVRGVAEEESSALLKTYFKQMRTKK